jgi:hypothetical protein
MKMIKNIEEFTDFSIEVATQLQLILYEVHPHIFELGSDIAPYFQLIWNANQMAPVISMHVQTSNVESIQFYIVAKNLCENLLLSQSYYTTLEGETLYGTDAEIADQMDRETQNMETTTQTRVDESEEPAIYVWNTPTYHAADPRAKERAEALKKRRGYGRFHE